MYIINTYNFDKYNQTQKKIDIVKYPLVATILFMTSELLQILFLVLQCINQESESNDRTIWIKS